MRQAISFGRFSSKPQEKGDSVARQRRAYESVCERHKDKCEPSVAYGFGRFFGMGESGFHGAHLAKGGSLAVLLALLQSGEIDPHKTVVVIEAFDRLSRLAPDLAMGLLSDIVRSGCAVAVDKPDLWIEPKDLGGSGFILIAAMLQLSHAESKQKSERVKGSWDSRRRNRKGALTTVCPRWCQHKAGRFMLVPEKVATVERIFNAYLEGKGGQMIARELNEAKVPVLGPRTKVWDQEGVRFILQSRATIGEYQPQQFVEVDGKRKRANVGEPILDYYPSAISRELFYRAQGALAARTKTQGRNTSTGVNVFKGIMWDAKSKSTMNIKVNHARGIDYRYLVPSMSVKDGANWFTVDYYMIESAFLRFAKELVIEVPDSGDRQIEMEEAIVADLTGRLERINLEEDMEALIPLVRGLTAKKKEAERRLEALRQARQQKPADDLQDLQALADGGEEPGVDLNAWREIIRNKIRGVVSEIWCLVIAQSKRTKTVVLQVFLRAGGCRWIVCKTTGLAHEYCGSWPEPYIDMDADLRHWRG